MTDGLPAQPRPRVVSVNVGAVREVEWRGRLVHTAIWKYPVGDRPVVIRGVNLDGDDQADRTVHGGPDKAVYAYSVEDYRYWRALEGIDTSAGLFGENLTIEGVDLRSVLVGERWRVGTVELEVAQPRLPCFKLGIRMHDATFPKRFQSAGRLGAYFRIVREGEVSANAEVSVTFRPAHRVTLGSMSDALHDHTRRHDLLAADYLPPFWLRVARTQLDE